MTLFYRLLWKICQFQKWLLRTFVECIQNKRIKIIFITKKYRYISIHSTLTIIPTDISRRKHWHALYKHYTQGTIIPLTIFKITFELTRLFCFDMITFWFNSVGHNVMTNVHVNGKWGRKDSKKFATCMSNRTLYSNRKLYYT